MTSFAHPDGHGLLLTSEDTCAHYNTRLPLALRSVNNDKRRCLSVWNDHTRKRPITTEVLPGDDATTTMKMCHKDMSSSRHRGILSHRTRHSGIRSFESTANIPQRHSLNGHFPGALLRILPSASRLRVASLSICYMGLRCASLVKTPNPDCT